MNIHVDIPLGLGHEALNEVRVRNADPRSRWWSWDEWLWSRTWWPLGCAWNGQVWRWSERVVALARLPVRPGGWRTDPFLRRPASNLAGWLVVLAVCGGLRLLPHLLAIPPAGP